MEARKSRKELFHVGTRGRAAVQLAPSSPWRHQCAGLSASSPGRVRREWSAGGFPEGAGGRLRVLAGFQVVGQTRMVQQAREGLNYSRFPVTCSGCPGSASLASSWMLRAGGAETGLLTCILLRSGPQGQTAGPSCTGPGVPARPSNVTSVVLWVSHRNVALISSRSR